MGFNTKIENGIKFTSILSISKQITLNWIVLLLMHFPVFSQDLKDKQEKDIPGVQVDQNDNRREIAVEDLPVRVSEDIIKNYPGSEISEAWEWIDETGKIEKYEVKVHNEGNDFYLDYDENGEAIKVEEVR